MQQPTKVDDEEYLEYDDEIVEEKKQNSGKQQENVKAGYVKLKVNLKQ